MDEVRVLRYRYLDGSVQAVFPMYVVEESDRHVVGWTPRGSRIMFWSTPDGRDPRAVPLEDRFRGRLTTAETEWTGSVLRVIPYDEPYQVLHFWNPEGAFACWYVNLETPKLRVGPFLDSVDLHLDLVIDPDGTHSWKDADEVVAALGTSHLDVAPLIAARDAVIDLLGGREPWPASVGDWRSFRPEARWQTPLAVPAGWNT